MKMRLFCLYDLKAEAPANNIFKAFSTDAEAARFFEGVIEHSETIISKHPGDFDLLCIGEIDFDTLSLTPMLGIRANPIARGIDVVRAIKRARGVVSSDDDSQLSLVKEG